MIYFKNLEVIYPGNEFHGKRIDLLVKDGKLYPNGPNSENAEEINAAGLMVSPGWLDMRSHLCDPGLEHKEDLLSGAESAMAGGFTGLGLLPNTEPVIDGKNGIAYVLNRTRFLPLDVYPYGAVTTGTKGKQLSEMYDMAEAGAVAFTDGDAPIWHSGILLKSLQYVQPINKLIINKAFDPYLSKEGVVHEGKNSTSAGLKGLPAIAESISIQKNLEILRYSGGKIHFSLVSTKEAVELIRKAKNEGLNITCDVAVHNLVLNDETIGYFDTNYKVFPPLRSEEHRKALIKGVKDGTIDCIVTDHHPQDIESKRLEYDLAEFGIIGHQTCYALLDTILEDSIIVEKIALNPRKVLGLELPAFKEGADANLTIYSKARWTFNAKSNQSKSFNSPYYNQELNGKAHWVINKNQIKKLD